jgi:brefeldin A-inhibited guanine nucleotide-exchange protein
LKTLDTLQRLLLDYGVNFNQDNWKMIFGGVLKPLFDEINYNVQAKTGSKSVQTIRSACQQTFGNLAEIFIVYYEHLKELLHELFSHFLNSIQSNQEVRPRGTEDHSKIAHLLLTRRWRKLECNP